MSACKKRKISEGGGGSQLYYLEQERKNMEKI